MSLVEGLSNDHTFLTVQGDKLYMGEMRANETGCSSMNNQVESEVSSDFGADTESQDPIVCGPIPEWRKEDDGPRKLSREEVKSYRKRGRMVLHVVDLCQTSQTLNGQPHLVQLLSSHVTLKEVDDTDKRKPAFRFKRSGKGYYSGGLSTLVEVCEGEM